MTVLNKGGFIPFYFNHELGKYVYLFMISSDAAYGGDKPMISKGGQEPPDQDGNQETILDTAIREAVEELGLRESNLDKIEVPFYLTSQKIKKGHLYVFAGKVKDPLAFDTPHYETAYTKWMTAEEFFKDGRQDHKVFIDLLERMLTANSPT